MTPAGGLQQASGEAMAADVVVLQSSLRARKETEDAPMCGSLSSSITSLGVITSLRSLSALLKAA
jgi:hypothetical protein